MPLKVSLRAGERLIVNGALISAENPTSLIFHNRATMILERQIMRPEEANTPSRRIYFAVQNAYVSEPGEKPYWVEQANRLIDELSEATTLPSVKESLSQLRISFQQGDYYPAMRTARALFAHDDKFLPPETRGMPPGKSGPAG